MYNETHFEKLTGFMSIGQIQDAKEGMKVKQSYSVCQDYAGECPITNVLSEMMEHLEGIEVGVDGFQAEFYHDETNFCLEIPLTLQLQNWQRCFDVGVNVPVGMIYIGRDETLPDGEQLSVGIDYAIGNYNLGDLDLTGVNRLITQKHIKDSIRGDCQHCAVASTVSEVFHTCNVTVDGSEVSIFRHDGSHISLLVSERLSQWIDAYDQENDVPSGMLEFKSRKGMKHYDKFKYELDFLSDESEYWINRISSKLVDLLMEDIKTYNLRQELKDCLLKMDTSQLKSYYRLARQAKGYKARPELLDTLIAEVVMLNNLNMDAIK